MQSSSSWKKTTSNSTRGSFSEEAWKRYNRRMQEEYEEEMERVVSVSPNKFVVSYETGIVLVFGEK